MVYKYIDLGFHNLHVSRSVLHMMLNAARIFRRAVNDTAVVQVVALISSVWNNIYFSSPSEARRVK